MKQRSATTVIILTAVLLVVALILGLLVLTGAVLFVLDFFDIYEAYEITDVTEYGKYIPVKDDGYMTENIDEIMPSEIEEFFTVQKYSYRMCHDPAFQEVYLEVVIEDEALYQAYVSEIVAERDTNIFYYDPSFSEVILTEDRATVTMRGNPDERSSYVDYAIIQKILFCDQANTVIFLSLDVPDSYLATVPSDLYYFERFSIDITGGVYHGAP